MLIDGIKTLPIENLESGISLQFVETYSIRAGDKVIADGFADARHEAMMEIDLGGVQYSAILDDRVCSFCHSLDGMSLNLNTDEGQGLFDRYSPPQHGRCRCMWIGISVDTPFKDNTKTFEKSWMKEIMSNLTLEGMGKTQILKKFAHENLINNQTAYSINEQLDFLKEDVVALNKKAKTASGQFEKTITKWNRNLDNEDFFNILDIPEDLDFFIEKVSKEFRQILKNML